MGRPWWITGLAVVCAVGVPFNALRDVLFEANRNVEVWAGFEVTGALAWATAPIHWAILALAAWGFWHRRAWMWPWAAVYVFYVAASHVVWSEVSPNGRGWPIGVAQAAAMAALGVVLLRARAQFRDGT